MNGDAALTFPWHVVRPSGQVDALHLLAGTRPAIRLLPLAGGDAAVAAWAREYGLDQATDAAGYVAVSRHVGGACRLLAVDAAAGAHTRQLGLLLGYPRCCIRAVAQIGESQIDRLVAAIHQSWHFGPHYTFIDPGGYTMGKAWVSHVPCRPDCAASLAQAARVLRYLHQEAAVRSIYLQHHPSPEWVVAQITVWATQA